MSDLTDIIRKIKESYEPLSTPNLINEINQFLPTS